MNIELSEIEQDALTEIFNVGIGQAAGAMNRMVHEEVLLKVPEVLVIPQQEASRYITQRVPEQVVAIRQRIRGEFSGNAILLFPEDNSLQLVRALLHDQVPLTAMTELEKEALVEIGNVMLNACFGTITNLLSVDVRIDLPELEQGGVEEIVSVEGSEAWVLMLQVHFHLPGQNINGFVSFILDVISMQHLKLSLKKFVSQISA